MKKLIPLTILVLSFEAFSQTRDVLNSPITEVNSNSAIIVRTSQTPNVVKVYFTVPMNISVCRSYSTRYVLDTSAPECENSFRLNNNTNQYQYLPHFCEMSETYCSSYESKTVDKVDHLKIKFKELPVLGGTEEETFLVNAKQRSFDSSDVEYEIIPLKTLSPYKVKSKGIFGVDSYVIKSR